MSNENTAAICTRSGLALWPCRHQAAFQINCTVALCVQRPQVAAATSHVVCTARNMFRWFTLLLGQVRLLATQEDGVSSIGCVLPWHASTLLTEWARASASEDGQSFSSAALALCNARLAS
jgi:hypothetical protein